MIVQSDIILPTHTLANLKDALRTNSAVDLMLPVIATTRQLAAADSIHFNSEGRLFPDWVSQQLNKRAGGCRSYGESRQFSLLLLLDAVRPFAYLCPLCRSLAPSVILPAARPRAPLAAGEPSIQR